MIEIDGPLWFVGAILVCGWHTLHLRAARRERLDHLAWWKRYDAVSQRRHDEFLGALRSNCGSTAIREDIDPRSFDDEKSEEVP